MDGEFKKRKFQMRHGMKRPMGPPKGMKQKVREQPNEPPMDQPKEMPIEEYKNQKELNEEPKEEEPEVVEVPINEEEKPQPKEVPKRQPKGPINPTLEKLRENLKARGPGEVICLAKELKNIDNSKSKQIGFGEFARVMENMHLDLTKEEIEELFELAEPDKLDNINYDEFLLMVREEMNDERTDIVLQAFNKMDVDFSGSVSYADTKNFFNCKSHIDVLSGQKTEEEVFNEFLKSFEMHHEFKKGLRDKRLSREEFIEYYDNISMSYDDDNEFIEMIKSAWGLTNRRINRGLPEEEQKNEPHMSRKGRAIGDRFNKVGVPENAPFGTDKEPTKYATSNNPNMMPNTHFAKRDEDIIKKFREVIISRGVRGIMSLRRAFMIADEKSDRKVDFDSFAQLFYDYRIDFSEEDINKLFDAFDKNNNGYIDYEEFIRGIVKPLNFVRSEIVRKAFEKLDTEGNGLVDPEVIKANFATKNHPDVILQKRTEEETICEFLDTFDYHFNLLDPNRERNSKISIDQFMEYYKFISMSIPSDNYFKAVISNAWDLEEKPNYGKGETDFNFGRGGWKKELDDRKKPNEAEEGEE
ncbi:MAG: EF-hand domain-containing protein [archaeon]|nr:EF-hand domain-containing protein [archaeon]